MRENPMLWQQFAAVAWAAPFHWSFSFHCPNKIPKRHFFALTQHFPPWEGCLLASCVFLVCLTQALQQHHQLDKILPALPTEQDPSPHPPAAIPIPQDGLLIFILTWWALYSNGCNHIFTIVDRTPNGWKPFPSLRFPWRHAYVLWFWGARNDHFWSRPQFTSNVWSQLCEM